MGDNSVKDAIAEYNKLMKVVKNLHAVEMALIEANDQLAENGSIHGHGFKNAIRHLLEPTAILAETVEPISLGAENFFAVSEEAEKIKRGNVV